jgi:hypothetical protein
MPDVATCLSTLQDRPDLATLQAGVDSGKVIYDAAKAGGCLDYLKRVWSTCNLSPFVPNAVADEDEEACAEFVVGTVAAGSGCFLAEECASRNCQQADPACFRLRQCCPGTCVAPPEPTPVGGDCSAAQNCVAGSYCVIPPGATTHTCEVPSTTRGTPCTETLQCASPLYCDLDLTTGTAVTGTCELYGTTGHDAIPTSSAARTPGTIAIQRRSRARAGSGSARPAIPNSRTASSSLGAWARPASRGRPWAARAPRPTLPLASSGWSAPRRPTPARSSPPTTAPASERHP